jgi:hypothetical protein
MMPFEARAFMAREQMEAPLSEAYHRRPAQAATGRAGRVLWARAPARRPSLTRPGQARYLPARWRVRIVLPARRVS